MRKVTRIKSAFFLCLFLLSPFINAAPVEVIDDTLRAVKLNQPAQRIISLSPHVTELLYEAGAGARIVAAVEYSDYPAAAKALPRVGSGYKLDIEAILGLKPDLIIGWKSGNQQAQIEQLKKLGLTIYLSEPKTLGDIAENLRDIGALTGEEKTADKKAGDFLKGIERLKQSSKLNKKVRVFYQVWQQPLFTINGDHIISHIIELCGGENVFAELSVVSPQIDRESVISRNPDVIVAGIGKGREDWLDNWKKWQSINAVKNQQIYGVDADLIVRHTPRILQGAKLMCDALLKASRIK